MGCKNNRDVINPVEAKLKGASTIPFSKRDLIGLKKGKLCDSYNILETLGKG